MAARAAEPLPPADAVTQALIQSKRLSRQVRATIQALAALQRTCEKYGIKLEVENPTEPEEA